MSLNIRLKNIYRYYATHRKLKGKIIFQLKLLSLFKINIYYKFKTIKKFTKLYIGFNACINIGFLYLTTRYFFSKCEIQMNF